MMKTLIAMLLSVMVNPTFSPDSTRIAFTRDNDLYVKDCASGTEIRLTFDGSELILNGYASWVYYEEIFGRQSKYRAFWWSPDSRKLAFYRFDNSGVAVFPIFSPFGQNGSLNMTRYPKAGSENPSVRIGFFDLSDTRAAPTAVWADFDDSSEQYFGTPFWGADSRSLFVQRQPRRQNELELFDVNAADGSRKPVYRDSYHTWLDWIDGMLFGPEGLYMVRNTGGNWEQIYYLSYDGRTCRALTEGSNWDVSLVEVNPAKSELWFVAKRDSRLHPSLYRLDRKGRITALTDPEYWVRNVRISPDFKTVEAELSNARTPWFKISTDARKGCSAGFTVLDKGQEKTEGPEPLPVMITNGGFELWGLISYPRDFDSTAVYPVVMQLYGGPGTPYVRDRWQDRDASDSWCWENGIIYMVVDPRSSGENGRAGMDQAFGRMTVPEQEDYLAWARWIGSKPYVDASRIGVEGFSFGGTTTAFLVLKYPEYFSCGIAGGGVYDWTLYDSHYTERFMDLPSVNPEGYADASAVSFVKAGKVGKGYKPGSLKLTHGTGDDNVHFQNTLLLVDALQRAGIQFELMIYPDGMHGYRDAQGAHSLAADHDFWTRRLLERGNCR